MTDQSKHTAKLTATPTESEAAIVIAALEENGVHASSEEYSSGLRAGAWNWVDVLVAEGDLEKAKEILEHVKRENNHIDWSQVDVGEPEDE